MWRKVVSNYRVALDTAVVVGAIVGLRAVLFALGVDGMSLSPLTSSIVAGGVFVMGLVVARTLSDVSPFLLVEFVVHAQAGEEGVAAEEVEELMSDVEEQAAELADVDGGSDPTAHA